MAIHTYQSTLISCLQIADGVFEATFKVLHPPLEFKPGQSIRICNESLSDEVCKGNTRDFSISSAPEEPYDSFSITFEESESPFKEALIKGNASEMHFTVEGPHGFFILPEDKDQPVLLIAHEIGISPFYSMICSAAKRDENRLIHLIYISDLKVPPYSKQLKEIESNHPNIAITEHFDSSIKPRDLENYVAFDKEAVWYIAGPAPSVRSCAAEVLRSIKIDISKLRTEEYSVYEEEEKDGFVREISETPVEPFSGEKIEQDGRFLAGFFQTTTDACLISITDKYGRIVYVNEMFESVTKYSREEVIGQSHRILKSAYHDLAFFKELWEKISTGNLWRGNIRNQAKDGTIYWSDASITSIKHPETGEIDYYISVSTLITDTKAMVDTRKYTIEVLERLSHVERIAEEKETFRRLAEDGLYISYWTLNKKDNSMTLDGYLRPYFAEMEEGVFSQDYFVSSLQESEKIKWENYIESEIDEYLDITITRNLLSSNILTRFYKSATKEVSNKIYLISHTDFYHKMSEMYLELFKLECESQKEFLLECFRILSDISIYQLFHFYFLKDERSDILYPSRVWYVNYETNSDIEKLQDTTNHIAFRKGNGMPGTCLATDDINILSRLEDKSTFIRKESFDRTNLKSAVGIPVRRFGKVIGVIECYSEFFTEADVELIHNLKKVVDCIGLKFHYEQFLSEMGEINDEEYKIY